VTTTLDKKQLSQILTPNVRRIMTVLNTAGETRVVGGVVRDVLRARKTGDIDLATTLPPERVMEILTPLGFKTVPTGLEFGTVTAVTDHIGFEITTLRRDVETDGRHATVAFTDDWRADAARRDFTFNALYVDSDGHLYDYFGGAEDAKSGHVRFIGDAQARIREDILRILRFFRFYALFGLGDADADAVAACNELADLIPSLSAERIAREIKKLLTAENPLPAWHLMTDCDVTSRFLPEATDLARLQKLLDAEQEHSAPTSEWVRLAALLPQDENIAAAVATRLKLSKHTLETLRVLAKLPALLHGNLAPAALRRLIYKYGADDCRAAVLLGGEKIAPALATLAAWESPVFPVKGEDIVKLGIPAGPRVGKILRAAEEWWIASDFRADRAAVLEQVHSHK
jgi:poly(A) polymerase